MLQAACLHIGRCAFHPVSTTKTVAEVDSEDEMMKNTRLIYMGLAYLTYLVWLAFAVAMMAMTPRAAGSPYAEQCSSRTSCPKWDGKPRVVKCPCQSSLHEYCQSICSLVFPWGGDREFNHAEAHVGIAPFACGSRDQNVSICESVRLGQCPFQCSTLSVRSRPYTWANR